MNRLAQQLEAWAEMPAASTLARTLLHSLWEGAIVALALATVLCFARAARLRYGAACVAMLILIGGPSMTFVRLASVRLAYTPSNTGSSNDARSGVVSGVHSAAKQSGNSDATTAAHGARSAGSLTWAVPLWLAGVFVFYVRGIAGWMAAWRLRRVGVCCAPELWRSRMARLQLRLRLSRPITLMESSLADVPVVMGYLRPVILMPVGLMAGLPTAQVEAILLHELAHIRRYDYLVNLLQLFVEGLLFYHPAVWWISGVMRTEREYCCDDMVVDATGGPLEYATALALLERRRVDGAVLAATGGNLLHRVERLLGRQHRYAVGIPVLTAATLAGMFVTGMMAFQVSSADRAPERAGATVISVTARQEVHKAVQLLAQATRPSDAAPDTAPSPSEAAPLKGALPAPVARTPDVAAPTAVPDLPDRKISVNDLLSVSVFNEPEVSKPGVRVGSDGGIVIPLLANRIHVEGLLPREAEGVIARAFIDDMILLHPSVSVTVLEYALRAISVVGDVKIPGQFDITAPITLLEAMAKAGWVTPEAGPELLLSRSATEAPRKIGIAELQSTNDPALNVTLTGGEVISVPDAPKVWVTGRVAHPQAVPLRDAAKATVLNVLASVEGLTDNYGNTAYIYRADGTGKRQEIAIPLKDIMHRKAKDVALLPDDILLIPDANGTDRRGMLRGLQSDEEPKFIDPKPPVTPGLSREK